MVCFSCKGTGLVKYPTGWGEAQEITCPKCGGSGKLTWGEIEGLAGLIETINDIKDRVDDLKEKVDEIKEVVDGL